MFTWILERLHQNELNPVVHLMSSSVAFECTGENRTGKLHYTTFYWGGGGHLSCLVAKVTTRGNQILQPPTPEEQEAEEEVEGPPRPKHWIGLGSEHEIEAESVRETRKKVQRLNESTASYLYIKSIFSLSFVQPLCLFVVSCLSAFPWSATVHILQRAQGVRPARLFFRPQRYRCSDRPHRLRLLPRQQLQHQAAAAGLQHPGYSHAAGQQRPNAMVLQQSRTPWYSRSPLGYKTDKRVLLNLWPHPL